MKRPYVLARAAHDVQLDVPAAALDIPRWLFGLSDIGYQRCARGHLGAGAGKAEDGRRTSVNVESVGGHLAVQHYVEEIAEPAHLKLVSERSDIWIFHLIHVRPRVTWEMTLIPSSERACTFHHEVCIEHPSLFIRIASFLCLVPLFVRRHDDEEAILFAASLASTAPRT
ncbi:MAG TPA: hypothetical protein VI078_04800 [bacterium]